MKRFLINFLGFALVTAGAAFALYRVQDMAAVAVADEPAGQAQEGDGRAQEAYRSSAMTAPLQERDPNRLWCREHGVYEDECTICRPEIAARQKDGHDRAPAERDPNRLWCREHGVYEDECTICHPEIAARKEGGHDRAPAERDPNRLWCREHGVYEDECTICHPEIAARKEGGHDRAPAERDPNRLWCREHGVYEDECTICHPEIAARKEGGHGRAPAERDPNRLWCRAHGLYEDECTICHPEIAARQKDGYGTSIESLFCSAHRVPEVECGICQPQLAENLTPGQSMQVRMASLESAVKAGIETGTPLPGVLAARQTLLCEAAFDQNRTAHISPLTRGVIQKVHVDLGEPIEEGQVLVEIASIEVAKVKSDYLKALDRERVKRLTYEREKDLVAKSVSAQQDFQQAEAEYQVAQTEATTARQQLVNYGLTDDDIASVREKRSSSSVLRIRAPFAGTLVDKHAVIGEAVEAGQPILQLVDLSRMWLELSIPESWIAAVKTGQAITATFAPLPGFSVDGVLTWISPQLDEESRMLKARAEVPNVGGALKQGLFGEVRMQNRSMMQRLLVPEDSVQKVDGKPFVFVKKEEDLFELRHIALGNRANQQFEIVQGLSPSDEIVIDGGFVLKSEFLKSRFGAGCAHD